MKIRGVGRLRRAARWVRNKFTPDALILLYHRVSELPSDPQLLSVRPQYFAEHLEVLQKTCHPMPLQQFVRVTRNGNLPRRTVVVTFDDGYADNLHNAKSLLEYHEIPATVFVTTGYVGHKRELWWDELDRLLLQPGTVPETLHLSVNGRKYKWALGKASHYSKEDFERHRGWNVLTKNDPSPRQELYRSLCRLLQPLPGEERSKVLDELITRTGVDTMVRSTHRTLSLNELVEMANGRLVEVGAHTVTHSLLSALPTAVQRSEIQSSKVRLEEILSRPVTSFSYPYGSWSDYTRQTVAITRDAGFDCACSNYADTVWQGTDPFQLPRVVVRDWDGETFTQWLEGWFRG